MNDLDLAPVDMVRKTLNLPSFKNVLVNLFYSLLNII